MSESNRSIELNRYIRVYFLQINKVNKSKRKYILY